MYCVSIFAIAADMEDSSRLEAVEEAVIGIQISLDICKPTLNKQPRI